MRKSTTATGSRHHAFTLVELLVVIGIIALLISILLPSLSRAREQSNRIKCESNIRQISLAMLQYTNENQGYFTGDGRASFQMYNDFIYWQQPANLWNAAVNAPRTVYSPTGANHLPTRYLDESPLQKYLGSSHVPLKTGSQAPSASVTLYGAFNRAVWMCPSDEGIRIATTWSSANGFYSNSSYTMNWYLSSNYDLENAPTPPAPLASTWMGGVMKFNRVHQPSDTIMMVEESFEITDGMCQLGSVTDYVSARHDRTAEQPDTYASQLDQTKWSAYDKQVGWFNARAKGVVSFVDGHVDYVRREIVQSNVYRKWDPTH